MLQIIELRFSLFIQSVLSFTGILNCKQTNFVCEFLQKILFVRNFSETAIILSFWGAFLQYSLKKGVVFCSFDGHPCSYHRNSHKNATNRSHSCQCGHQLNLSKLHSVHPPITAFHIHLDDQ